MRGGDSEIERGEKERKKEDKKEKNRKAYSRRRGGGEKKRHYRMGDGVAHKLRAKVVARLDYKYGEILAR
jgi:hypothetical protein